MRYLSTLIVWALFISTAFAQEYEGRLLYKQTIAGQETMVTVYIRPQQALIQRGNDKPTFYLVTSGSPLFQAWTTGAVKSDEAKLANLSAVKPLKAAGSEQVIAGFKAKPFKVELANGQTISGWYAPEVVFDHNQLLARIQGAEWAQLPGKGLLLRWEVSSAKGGKMLSGELIDHQRGKQDPSLFQAPRLTAQ